MAKGLGSRQGSQIVKIGQVDLVESLSQAVRGKIGQEIRVNQNSSEEVNRLDRTSSSGHSTTNARYNILVIVTIHQDVIITEELAI